jgi:hypothetical protein
MPATFTKKKVMRHKLLILAALAALPMGAPQAAELLGTFKREFYQDVLRADAEADPTAGITSTTFVNAIEAPVNTGANFTQRLSGWYTPATSGNYVFFIAGDDDSDLFLSTDATPAQKKLIAQDAGWSGSRSWVSIGGAPSTPEDKRSDTFAATEWPTGGTITLTGGTKYWLEAYAHEGGGGDNLAVYIKKVADPDPANGTAPSLAGGAISTEAPTVAITTQPASWSTSENFPTTIQAAVNTMAAVTLQWQVNGVNIPGATNLSYTFTPTLADTGKAYRLVVTQGTTPPTVINSTAATLTVTTDTTAPTITGAGTFLDRNGVVVTFSEPIGPGLATAANYAISGGVTVNSAQAVGDRSVFLSTSALTAGANHTLTVSNVRDLATGGGNLVSPNTRPFTVIATPAGTQLSAVGYQRFEATDSWDAFQTKLTTGVVPEVDGLLANMEAPVDVADTHGTRMRTYFIAPKTGNYVFYGHSDDRGAFYLSTDSDPANKKLIATEPVWNGNRAWTTLDRRDPLAPENRSSTYRGTEWPGGGSNIRLIGGQKYYAEVQFLEGGGGDNGGLSFSIVDDPAYPVPGDGEPTRMVGTNITWFGDAATFVSNFSMPGSKVFKRGDTVSLEPIVTGPGVITYQWYKNKKPVTGATSKNLVLTGADYDDIGDYALEVTIDGGEPIRKPVEEGDDNVRLYMDGITMLIEAEDYNYGGGQHIPAADLPSYRGDAYKGLKSTLNVDFFHDGDNSGGAAFAYNRMLPADPGVIEDKGGTDAVNNALGRNRGSFSVTANYALGWTEPGEWQNYTRTFQKGKYVVIGGVSHDAVAEDEINMVLSKVANPTVNDNSTEVDGTVTEGGGQGLTKLGSFLGLGTGAWSSNDMIPLTDDLGNIVQLDLEGLTTLRLTFNAVDGDADWFAFYCLDCTTTGGQPTISISRTGNNVTISSDSGGTVQASPTIGPATWTDLGAAPQTVSSASGNRFFRIVK